MKKDEISKIKKSPATGVKAGNLPNNNGYLLEWSFYKFLKKKEIDTSDFSKEKHQKYIKPEKMWMLESFENVMIKNKYLVDEGQTSIFFGNLLRILNIIFNTEKIVGIYKVNQQENNKGVSDILLSVQNKDTKNIDDHLISLKYLSKALKTFDVNKSNCNIDPAKEVKYILKFLAEQDDSLKAILNSNNIDINNLENFQAIKNEIFHKKIKENIDVEKTKMKQEFIIKFYSEMFEDRGWRIEGMKMSLYEYCKENKIKSVKELNNKNKYFYNTFNKFKKEIHKEKKMGGFRYLNWIENRLAKKFKEMLGDKKFRNYIIENLIINRALESKNISICYKKNDKNPSNPTIFIFELEKIAEILQNTPETIIKKDNYIWFNFKEGITISFRFRMAPEDVSKSNKPSFFRWRLEVGFNWEKYFEH